MMKWTLIAILGALMAQLNCQVPGWHQQLGPQPTLPCDGDMVFDSYRGVIVHYGGSTNSSSPETWEFASGQWSLRTTSTHPGNRYWHQLAYDSTRNVVVLHGGKDAQGYLTDTWEYDGNDWVQIPTTTHPNGRHLAGMCFDPNRSRVVLIGGNGEGSTTTFMTWEYDGVDWTPTVNHPKQLMAPGLVFDSARSKVLLHGGYDMNQGAYENQTWEYDGQSWQQIMTAVNGPTQAYFGMAYDSNRGVTVASGRGGPTWEFDGNDWSTSPNNGTVPTGGSCIESMAFDASINRMVLLTESSSPGPGSGAQTWLYESLSGITGPSATISSSLVGSTTVLPPVRGHRIAAMPNGDHLLFGGTTANGPLFPTYELSGTAWSKVISTINPTSRTFHSLIFDELRANNLMFGGADPLGGILGDTWSYQGGQWSYVTPAHSPTPRLGHAMSFDPSSGLGILFGGRDGAGNTLSDMWSWDGTDWAQLSPPTLPPGRSNHGMAYDRYRGRMVLFGGLDTTGKRNDLWEWDGLNWTQVTPTTHGGAVYEPSARQNFTLSYDPNSERVVMIGGETDIGCTSEIWTWDGNMWIRLVGQPNTAWPQGRIGLQAFTDSTTGGVRMHGGGCFSWFSNEMWEFGLPVFARSEVVGLGCAGSNGVPTLAIINSTRPVLGTTVDFRYSNALNSLFVTPAVISVGFDNMSYQGIPLPLPLGAIGLPGCTLYHSAEVNNAVSVLPGTAQATWSLALPNHPAFIGDEAWVQGLHLELAPSGPWAALSNAIQIRIGDQ